MKKMNEIQLIALGIACLCCVVGCFIAEGIHGLGGGILMAGIILLIAIPFI